MIILTDKAKSDFGFWLFQRRASVEEQANFRKLSETAKYAIIIEWFDSVGIYIGVGSYDNYHKIDFAFNIVKFDGEHDSFDCGFEDRIKATKESIIVANELYNKR